MPQRSFSEWKREQEQPRSFSTWKQTQVAALQPAITAVSQNIPPAPKSGLGSMAREAALGYASGAGLPETTHASDFAVLPGLYQLATNPEAWKALGEGLYQAHAGQLQKAKEAWQAGGVEGTASALIRGASALVPFIGPAAEMTGESIGSAQSPEELAHGIGQGAGMISTLALGTAKGQSAPAANLRTMKAAGQAAKEQVLTRPQTVRTEVTKGALELLKKAQSEAFSNASKRYPKLKNVEFVKDRVLSHFPEESIFPGVKAIRQKLIGDHPNAPFTEKNIRNARAEAWTYLRRNLPRDEQVAYQNLYDAMTKELRNAYANEGHLAGFERAEKNWAKMMDTFKAPDSPVFKALDAERITGEFEPSDISGALGQGDVAASQLRRLQSYGVPESLPREMRLLEYGRGLSDPTVLKTGISFTAKVPIIREALSYILTRPKLFPSLQKRAAQRMAEIDPEYIPRARQLTEGHSRLTPRMDAGPPEVQGPGMTVHPGTRASRTGRLLPAAGKTTRPSGEYAQPPAFSIPGRGGPIEVPAMQPSALEALFERRGVEFPRPTVSGPPARRYGTAREGPPIPTTEPHTPQRVMSGPELWRNDVRFTPSGEPYLVNPEPPIAQPYQAPRPDTFSILREWLRRQR